RLFLDGFSGEAPVHAPGRREPGPGPSLLMELAADLASGPLGGVDVGVGHAFTNRGRNFRERARFYALVVRGRVRADHEVGRDHAGDLGWSRRTDRGARRPIPQV